MRRNLKIICGCVIVLAVICIVTAQAEQKTSQFFVEQTQQLVAVIRLEQWGEAEEQLKTIEREWDSRRQGMQLIVVHEDTDSVTTGLLSLSAGIEAQTMHASLDAGLLLIESFRHLQHRDNFTLSNLI